MSAINQAIEALSQLNDDQLRIIRGIEKEGMRVSPDGKIAQSQHPEALGSTLTHPSITTDYSEALLEFITPVFSSAEEALECLNQIQRFTSQNIGDEEIWPTSMPPKMDSELDVPIAEYGESNIGKIKNVYRHGLWHRYGRIMQSIAGLHYNFSVPEAWWPILHKLDNSDLPLQDYISQRYFDLIRNFRRYSWILFYLFGASPALDKSFVQNNEHNLGDLNDDTLSLPYATSLRMSDLGYQNSAQASLFVCYNALDTYINTLRHALKVKYPEFEAIGVKRDGEYKQLNTSLLQIENEYYSEIRPKRVTQSGEKPLHALNERGVEYIEVRCMDLNPFAENGVDLETVKFLDSFLLFCLLQNSPKMDDDACNEAVANQKLTIYEGRKPDLKLKRNKKDVELKTWGQELLKQIQPVAAWLDQVYSESGHRAAVENQFSAIENPELTLSGKILQDMDNFSQSFQTWSMAQAGKIKLKLAQPLNDDLKQQFKKAAEDSLRSQQKIESEDDLDFDSFVANYLKG